MFYIAFRAPAPAGEVRRKGKERVLGNALPQHGIGHL